MLGHLSLWQFFGMNFAFRLLIVAIALSPAFLINDSLFIHGVLAAYVAVMVLLVAWSIRPGEAAFLAGIIRPAMIFAIFPAAWIVLQAIPMPFDGLRHPIWISAETALGRTLWGSISISPGDTLLALMRYFSACGLFFVGAAVTIDRQRAEVVLLWLAGMTTLLALTLIIHNLGGFIFLGEISSSGARAAITAAVTLGTVLTSTTVIYAIERYETRRSRADFSRGLFIVMTVTSVTAFLLTLIAIALFASRPALFAALSGVGTFVLIVGFRRIGLGAGLGFLLACIAVAVPLSIIAGSFFLKSPDISLRFVTDAPKSQIDLTQRMISDSGWAGSGAGTYSALLPIYQDPSNSVVTTVAPTTAAGYLIELGRPALWIAIATAFAVIGWLTHGALQRGRDSFFTAAGASCTVILTLEAFFDASLSGSTAIVLAMTVLGLAVSQSVSRTARQL
jgi:hypothetical protein